MCVRVCACVCVCVRGSCVSHLVGAQHYGHLAVVLHADQQGVEVRRLFERGPVGVGRVGTWAGVVLVLVIGALFW